MNHEIFCMVTRNYISRFTQPSVSRPLIKDVSVDDVMRRMPAMSKAKSQEAVNTVSSLLKAMNLLQLNASVQVTAACVYAHSVVTARALYTRTL